MTNNYSEIRSKLETLALDDGFTLKRHAFVEFKTGYQVATEGVEVDTALEALKAIEGYNGNCGVWRSPETGKYCVDLSHRESTKKTALRIGRKCNQYSILRWRDKKCIKCSTGKPLK